MTNSFDMTVAIRELAFADPQTRLESARAIHRAGVGLCGGVVEEWSRNAEFRALLVSPKQTQAASPLDGLRIIVGVAVQPATFDRIRTANEEVRLANVPPDQDALEFELHFGHGAELDILTTKAPGEEGAIARFLSKFGEGIQQVEIYVTDVDRATEVLQQKFQLNPIYPATRAGADGTLVNFFLATAPQNKKILLELVQDHVGHA
jgi:hypothetical protein